MPKKVVKLEWCLALVLEWKRTVGLHDYCFPARAFGSPTGHLTVIFILFMDLMEEEA